jgi:hypothetical protein
MASSSASVVGSPRSLSRRPARRSSSAGDRHRGGRGAGRAPAGSFRTGSSLWDASAPNGSHDPDRSYLDSPRRRDTVAASRRRRMWRLGRSVILEAGMSVRPGDARAVLAIEDDAALRVARRRDPDDPEPAIRVPDPKLERLLGAAATCDAGPSGDGRPTMSGGSPRGSPPSGRFAACRCWVGRPARRPRRRAAARRRRSPPRRTRSMRRRTVAIRRPSPASTV